MDKKTKWVVGILLIAMMLVSFCFCYMVGVMVGTHRTHEYYNWQKIEAWKKVIENDGF